MSRRVVPSHLGNHLARKPLLPVGKLSVEAVRLGSVICKHSPTADSNNKDIGCLRCLNEAQYVLDYLNG
jgi:hypothetical protein